MPKQKQQVDGPSQKTPMTVLNWALSKLNPPFALKKFEGNGDSDWEMRSGGGALAGSKTVTVRSIVWRRGGKINGAPISRDSDPLLDSDQVNTHQVISDNLPQINQEMQKFGYKIAEISYRSSNYATWSMQIKSGDKPESDLVDKLYHHLKSICPFVVLHSGREGDMFFINIPMIFGKDAQYGFKHLAEFSILIIWNASQARVKEINITNPDYRLTKRFVWGTPEAQKIIDDILSLKNFSEMREFFPEIDHKLSKLLLQTGDPSQRGKTRIKQEFIDYLNAQINESNLRRMIREML